MLIMYGECNRNTAATSRAYIEKYPNRERRPNPHVIEGVVQRATESGNLIPLAHRGRGQGVLQDRCVAPKTSFVTRLALVDSTSCSRVKKCRLNFFRVVSCSFFVDVHSTNLRSIARSLRGPEDELRRTAYSDRLSTSHQRDKLQFIRQAPSSSTRILQASLSATLIKVNSSSRLRIGVNSSIATSRMWCMRKVIQGHCTIVQHSLVSHSTDNLIANSSCQLILRAQETLLLSETSFKIPRLETPSLGTQSSRTRCPWSTSWLLMGALNSSNYLHPHPLAQHLQKHLRPTRINEPKKRLLEQPQRPPLQSTCVVSSLKKTALRASRTCSPQLPTRRIQAWPCTSTGQRTCSNSSRSLRRSTLDLKQAALLLCMTMPTSANAHCTQQKGGSIEHHYNWQWSRKNSRPVASLSLISPTQAQPQRAMTSLAQNCQKLS
ncbi:unnamed protein product [Trichogramma brassicae]|uniref:DUF4817 domain-containing protein n=1 Tax=Trichogramma brassicae TaxID=86971 RepID=A0A6H5IG38_9HYME|nr:unnamed protein product [Trichogramma brassicae]